MARKREENEDAQLCVILSPQRFTENDRTNLGLRGKKKEVAKGGGYLSLMPTSTGGGLPTVDVCGHGGGGVKNIGKTADVLCERPLIFIAN